MRPAEGVVKLQALQLRSFFEAAQHSQESFSVPFYALYSRMKERSRQLKKEAPGGIEPPHKGFADLSLTTWVRRQSAGNIPYFASECKDQSQKDLAKCNKKAWQTLRRQALIYLQKT